jgi:hypothetical protein
MKNKFFERRLRIMANKEMKARIVHKNDIEANWI